MRDSISSKQRYALLDTGIASNLDRHTSVLLVQFAKRNGLPVKRIKHGKNGLEQAVYDVKLKD